MKDTVAFNGGLQKDISWRIDLYIYSESGESLS